MDKTKLTHFLGRPNSAQRRIGAAPRFPCGPRGRLAAQRPPRAAGRMAWRPPVRNPVGAAQVRKFTPRENHSGNLRENSNFAGRATQRENVCEYFARKILSGNIRFYWEIFSREIFADIFAPGRAARFSEPKNVRNIATGASKIPASSSRQQEIRTEIRACHPPVFGHQGYRLTWSARRSATRLARLARSPPVPSFLPRARRGPAQPYVNRGAAPPQPSRQPHPQVLMTKIWYGIF